MVDEKGAGEGPLPSLAESIRQRIRAEKKHDDPRSAAQNKYSGGFKKCVGCSAEYEDTNLMICPKDGAMLFTPFTRNLSWFDCAKSPDTPVKRCPQCNEVFAHKYLRCPTDKAELEPSDFRSIEAPELEDRFQLCSFVSSDKLFNTYLANDLVENRTVSVNFLNAVLSQDKQTATHFLTLGKRAIGLAHPNLISVFSVNLTTQAPLDGIRSLTSAIPYLVNDYVISNSLEAEIAARRMLDTATASKVFADALSALGFAHDLGITHGAISKSNLRMTDGVGSQAKGYVSNFGLAERLFREMEWDGKPSTETHTSNVYGDPDGMCPEFCRGERPSCSTDLYQIGCALYEAVCGRPPFERPAMTQVLMAHMTDDPDDIAQKNSNIPAPLVKIIMKCLKKDPTDRYPSAQALSDELQQFIKT